MGTSSSRSERTPARGARGTGLGGLLDPRSPSAGILRTPIEVMNSSCTEEFDCDGMENEEKEDVDGDSCTQDPRSPTLDVSRCPLKQCLAGEQPTGSEEAPQPGTESAAPAIKEISAPGKEGGPAPGAEADELVRKESDEANGEGDPTQGECGRKLGSRRRKGRHGARADVLRRERCPLQLLHDDNSPTGSVVWRQVKMPLVQGRLAADRPGTEKENLRSSWTTRPVWSCPP